MNRPYRRWDDPWAITSRGGGGNTLTTPATLGAVGWYRALEAVDDGTGHASSVVPKIGPAPATVLFGGNPAIGAFGPGGKGLTLLGGIANELGIAGAMLNVARPNTLVCVGLTTGDVTGETLLRCNFTVQNRRIQSLVDSFACFDGAVSVASGAVNMATPWMFAAVYDTTPACQAYYNGAPSGLNQALAIAASGVQTNTFLGLSTTNTEAYVWGEFSLYNAALTATQLMLLYATYLRPLYGLP